MGRDCMVIVEISLDTELLTFHSHSGNGLEGAGHPVVKLGKETAQSLLRSPRTELFAPVELYSEDGLEMAGNSVVHWGRDLNDHCLCLMRQNSLK